MKHRIRVRKDTTTTLSDDTEIEDSCLYIIKELACSTNSPKRFKQFLKMLQLPDDDDYQIIISFNGKIVAAQNIDFE